MSFTIVYRPYVPLGLSEVTITPPAVWEGDQVVLAVDPVGAAVAQIVGIAFWFDVGGVRFILSGVQDPETFALTTSFDEGTYQIGATATLSAGPTVDTPNLAELSVGPPPLAADTFDGSGPLGGEWTGEIGFTNQSGGRLFFTSDLRGVYRETGVSGAGGHAAEADWIPAATANQRSGIVVCSDGTENNEYRIQLRGPEAEVRIARVTGGGFTTLLTQPFAFTGGQTYRVRAEAREIDATGTPTTQIRVVIGGAEVAVWEGPSAHMANTKVGLRREVGASDPAFDNFRALALVA